MFNLRAVQDTRHLEIGLAGELTLQDGFVEGHAQLVADIQNTVGRFGNTDWRGTL